MAGVAENSNGDYVDMERERGDKGAHSQDKRSFDEEVTLYTIFNRLVTAILFPSSDRAYASIPLLQRIKVYLSQNVPLLREAFKNTAHHVFLWTRRGSPFRALLVVSVGTIALLFLTGLLVFMLFFVSATVNAVVVSLLMSLAAVGGFLAIFFACATAIYIGALSIAICVISVTIVSAVIAVLIASGWVGFFCTVWLAGRKTFNLAKRSFSITGSAVSTVSAYSSARFARHHHEPYKLSD